MCGVLVTRGFSLQHLELVSEKDWLEIDEYQIHLWKKEGDERKLSKYN